MGGSQLKKGPPSWSFLRKGLKIGGLGLLKEFKTPHVRNTGGFELGVGIE
jgi:hypothetical protein